jgi:curli biogenesis system outer membrane secretion channel CsgG
MRGSILAAVTAALAWPQAAGPSEEAMLAGLLEIRRVYVEKLGSGEGAEPIRDMLITALQKSGLFVVTENQERADAYLRGSAEDLVFTDTFQSSDSVDGRVSAGANNARSSSNRRGAYLSAGAGQSESTRIAERKHEAAAAVRLVNKDGDVIWSTTQESTGGKFRGASADLADKVTKQLIADFERARKVRAKSN